MAKATHQGTCQICGAVQKLPGNVLSLHGYTTRWGFFAGVCDGARHLPFEVSADRVAAAIESAERTAARLRTQAAELRQPTGSVRVSARVWVDARRNAGGYIEHGGYRVASGELVAAEKPHCGQWFQLVTDAGERHFVNLRAPRGDVVAAVVEANRLQAARLERQAHQMGEYIAWQRERLQAWAPAELKPL